MAQQLYFSRDSEMIVEIGTDRWAIPVLEGFSFSQATNISEIGLNEMESTAGVSRRGRRAFNDSLSAAEFSFSTYIRPFKAGDAVAGSAGAENTHHAVEEVLWALFSGPATYASATFTNQFKTSTTDTRINLSQSNVSELGPATADGASIYFKMGDAEEIVYKLKKVVLNEATINFDIDGIAQIDWSGMASEIESGAIGTFPTATIYEAQTATTNFIRNRLTTLAVQVGSINDITVNAAGSGYSSVPNITFTAAPAGGVTATARAVITGGALTDVILTNAGAGYVAVPTIGVTGGGGSSGTINATTLNTVTNPGGGAVTLASTYNLTLTGGSITMTNNVAYVTPEELGIVNVAVGHTTGSRAVSGSFTCYLTEDTTNDTASRDLFDDMTALTTVTSNKFDLRFSVGGAAGIPRLEVHCPQAHIDIPTHSIEDLISLETTFNALPSSLDVADDANLAYVGIAY
jgi:hypothetical protein